MALKLITPPAYLPVTVSQAKEHMRVEGSTDDDYIAALIASSVDYAELSTGRQLVEATYELVLDAFPWDKQLGIIHNGVIELPRPSLLTVTSIKYIDADGVEQTLASTEYTVDTDSLVGRVYPAYLKYWPRTRAVPAAVRIRYTCGWPMSDETSPPAWTGPESIKTWIMVRVATLYSMRESLVQGQAVAELPRSYVDGLLDAHRIYKVV